ncbi:hypothetical protein, partial [Frateuria defendens]|uniref:hypothetical protein n=1 Tax=Frateuria defendens TaxID=2219559 RepID=UPI001F1E0133
TRGESGVFFGSHLSRAIDYAARRLCCGKKLRQQPKKHNTTKISDRKNQGYICWFLSSLESHELQQICPNLMPRNHNSTGSAVVVTAERRTGSFTPPNVTHVVVNRSRLTT